jgi:hypothetical protein
MFGRPADAAFSDLYASAGVSKQRSGNSTALQRWITCDAFSIASFPVEGFDDPKREIAQEADAGSGPGPFSGPESIARFCAVIVRKHVKE